MKAKRFFSLVIVAVLLSTILLPALADEPEHKYYSDINSTDTCYNAANYLYEHGISQGYIAPTETELGVFRPNQAITRGQMALFLWRMLNKPQPSGNPMTFTDCAQGAYYYDAVQWASSANVGIINGYGNGSFEPDAQITQQAVCIMLFRFACHCGYSSNSSTALQEYAEIFNASNIIDKANFADNAKAAAGWAYSHGLLSNNVIHDAYASRGNVAEYVYTFYQQFQNKYGLCVVNTDNMSYVSSCGKGMQSLFINYGAENCAARENITKAQFHSAMSVAFSSAKALDICYLYIASHGAEVGLCLFTDTYLSPDYLRNEIDRFNGTFIVFVSGCHSGTYISENSVLYPTNDVFDASNFVNGLYDVSLNVNYSEDLRDSKRIKTICSSRKDELSYSTNRFATYYWCLGAGYNLNTKQFGAIYADYNCDGRITLNELHSYSYQQIKENLPIYEQTVVCYPQNDSFVIFESTY